MSALPHAEVAKELVAEAAAEAAKNKTKNLRLPGISKPMGCPLRI
jgi:hypothetical protein